MSTSEDGAPPAALASGSSAEAQAAAFADDPRVHFDRQAGTWRFEQDDGTELEYDGAKGAWVPVVSTPDSSPCLRSSCTCIVAAPTYL